MKIRKITYQDNQIFGNLVIDFTSENEAVNTVILAGENGVGKSLLLNHIFELSVFKFDSLGLEEIRIFEIEFSTEEMNLLSSDSRTAHYFNANFKNNVFTITLNNKKIDFKIEGILETNELKLGNRTLLAQGQLRRNMKALFSDVEINFRPNAINTITSNNIDRKDLFSQKTGQNLATEITQLLIDVQSLDAHDFTEWGRKNVGNPIKEHKIDSRIKRFTSAFESIFPQKKYKKIQNIDNRKEVIFEENGKEMSIAQLSSGEKQIVFRGSFLLKDKESTKGALVLIDEPEISLHPNWQLKILSFYKNLFINEDGFQTSQIILSTHSPFILHNSNRNHDKVIILKKNLIGQTVISEKAKFYGWSNERLVQNAFNINHFLTENRTTVFLEGETDEKYFNRCFELFYDANQPMDFKWIGRTNDSGNSENSGDTALNHAKNFFRANPEQLKGKVILLYDSDTNKPEECYENLFIRKMSMNTENIVFRIGVENLLCLDTSFDLSKFYKETKTTDNYGGSMVKNSLDKSALCEFICETLDENQQKKIFRKLNDEIKELAKFLH